MENQKAKVIDFGGRMENKKSKGWIYLHRQIAENDYLMTSASAFTLFLKLILKANHSDRYDSNINGILKRGECFTTIDEMQSMAGERYGRGIQKCGLKTIKRHLGFFRREGSIKTIRKKNGLVVKILNYDKFQGVKIRTKSALSETTQSALSETETIDHKNQGVTSEENLIRTISKSDFRTQSGLSLISKERIRKKETKEKTKKENFQNQKSEDQNQNPPDQNPIQKSLFKSSNSNPTVPEKMPLDRSGEFESEFWPVWPVKKNKKAALDRWNQLAKSKILPPTSEIVQALKAQILEKKYQVEFKIFCPVWPNPATWLNGHRWDDEVSSRDQIQAQAQHENRNRKNSNECTPRYSKLGEEKPYA